MTDLLTSLICLDFLYVAKIFSNHGASDGFSTSITLKPLKNTLCRIESERCFGGVLSFFPVRRIRKRQSDRPTIRHASTIAA